MKKVEKSVNSIFSYLFSAQMNAVLKEMFYCCPTFLKFFDKNRQSDKSRGVKDTIKIQTQISDFCQGSDTVTF